MALGIFVGRYREAGGLKALPIVFSCAGNGFADGFGLAGGRCGGSQCRALGGGRRRWWGLGSLAHCSAFAGWQWRCWRRGGGAVQGRGGATAVFACLQAEGGHGIDQRVGLFAQAFLGRFGRY